MCSGVGLCDVYSRCDCSDGFEGPSCELRTCPSGEAWGAPYGLRGPYDYAFQSEVHADAVCSGRGLCDRATGHCACQHGFEGAACERLSCPQGTPTHHNPHSTCSGHGLCTNLERLAREFNYWDFPRPTYTQPWDKEKVYGCLCEPGYSGFDCSLRECSVGDDPLARNRGKVSDFERTGWQAWRDTADKEFQTANSRDHGTTKHAAQNSADWVVSDYGSKDRRFKAGVEQVGDGGLVNEKQLVYCQATGGYFTLRLGTMVSGRISHDAGPQAVERALAALKVGAVRVTFSNPDAAGACGGTLGPGSGGGGRGAGRTDNVVVVEFLQLAGRDARMQAFTGGDASVPPLELEAPLTKLTPSTGYVTLAHGSHGSLLGEQSVATNRLAQVCSGRGLCDEEVTGLCTCQRGFIASDRLKDGGPGGLRLRKDGLPAPGEGGGANDADIPGLRARIDGLPSPAFGDCGALDPSIFPAKLFSVDRANGEGGGVGGGAGSGEATSGRFGKALTAKKAQAGSGACPGTSLPLLNAESGSSDFSSRGGGQGACSGHGVCSGEPGWRCACEIGWGGFDCSLRECATGRAWFDFPRRNDEAHWALTECSGRGACDRELGVCRCGAGYRGAACDTLDCPIGRVFVVPTASAAASAAAAAAAVSGTGEGKGAGSSGSPHQALLTSSLKNPTGAGGRSAWHRLGEAAPEATIYSDLERSLGLGEPLAAERKGGSGFTRLRGSAAPEPRAHRESSATAHRRRARGEGAEPDAPPGFGDAGGANAPAALSAGALAAAGHALGAGAEDPSAFYGFERLRNSPGSGLVGSRGRFGGLEAASVAGRWSLPPPGTYCSGHGVCLSQAEHTARALDWRGETDVEYGERVEQRTRCVTYVTPAPFAPRHTHARTRA